MKVNKTLTALIASAGLGLSGHAFAAGTDSGTTIKNDVTLSYSVGTTPQAVLSDTAAFMVDTKVDLEIQTQTASNTIVPGDAISYTYTLTNSGNKAQVYELSFSNSADASDSGNISLSGVTYAFHASNTSSGSITNSNFLTIPEDETATYTVSFTFPQKLDDATTNILDTDSFYFVAGAQAVLDDTGTSLPDHTSTDKNDSANLTTSQLVVLAEDASNISTTTDTDAAYNGSDIVISTTTVATARFTHKDALNNDVDGPGLSVLVVNDDICNGTYVAGDGVPSCDGTVTGYTPKAIPGAMVEYTITATNSGSTDATSVVFTQNLSTLDELDNATTDLKTGSLANPTTSHGSAIISGDTITVNAGTVSNTTDSTVTITFTAIVAD